MEEYFSNRAQEAVRSAQEAAKGMGAAQIGTDHLLVGVARDRGSVAAWALVLRKVKIKKGKIKAKKEEPEEEAIEGEIVELSFECGKAVGAEGTSTPAPYVDVNDSARHRGFPRKEARVYDQARVV